MGRQVSLLAEQLLAVGFDQLADCVVSFEWVPGPATGDAR
jgi:hypothetical protein